MAMDRVVTVDELRSAMTSCCVPTPPLRKYSRRDAGSNALIPKARALVLVLNNGWTVPVAGSMETTGGRAWEVTDRMPAAKVDAANASCSSRTARKREDMPEYTGRLLIVSGVTSA